MKTSRVKYSVTQLRKSTKEALDKADKGEEIIIERDTFPYGSEPKRYSLKLEQKKIEDAHANKEI